MKSPYVFRLTAVRWLCLSVSLLTLACANGFAQTMTFPEIQAALRAQPPTGGDPAQRETAIRDLDLYLKNDASRTDPNAIALYEGMMGFVASEIDQPVAAGVRIWSMYNSGYVVKTPSATFAFDLLDGYSGWSYRIPDSVLQRIQVLFVTHHHSDHYKSSIVNSVKGFGGIVVSPSEDSFGTIGMAPDQETTVGGLHVKAYDGSHSGTPSRIFKVTIPEGLSVMHTGDNQSSTYLPDSVTADVLFVAAWVDDYGSTTPVIGVRNCINKMSPRLTIPCHIQELGMSAASRTPYEWPLAVDDEPVPGRVSVQTWGERYDLPFTLYAAPAGVRDWIAY